MTYTVYLKNIVECVDTTNPFIFTINDEELHELFSLYSLIVDIGHSLYFINVENQFLLEKINEIFLFLTQN